MAKDINTCLQNLSEECFVISERLALLDHELQVEQEHSQTNKLIKISEIHDGFRGWLQKILDLKKELNTGENELKNYCLTGYSESIDEKIEQITRDMTKVKKYMQCMVDIKNIPVDK